MIRQQYISVSAVIRTITIMMLIVMLSFSVLVGYFLYLIEEGEARDLHTRIESSLRVVAEKAVASVYEYSYWDESYRNLVEEKNQDWIDKNINDYLLPEYDFDFLAVLNKDYKFDLLAQQQKSRINAELLQSIQYPDVENLPRQGMHFYQNIDDVIYNIIISPFISEDSGDKHQEALVIGIAMTNGYLSDITSRFRLPHLSFTSQADTKYRVGLNDYYGQIQASIIWEIMSPTRRILPYIVGSGLVLLIVSFFIVRHVLFREFHSRSQYEERLYDAATKDNLTKIANRQFFYDYSEYNFKTYQKQNRHYSFLMIDLDHFKEVNEQFGHVAGNHVLIHFTKTVRGLLPDEATFGRVGGEEFAILLPDSGSTDSVHFIEQIRDGLKETPIKYEGMSGYVVSFSTGIATHDLNCSTLAELTNKAGVALYQAKKAGRSQTVVAKDEL